MILIFSDEDDLSTNEVMDWLADIGQSCVRVHRNDTMHVVACSLVNGKPAYRLRIEREHGGAQVLSSNDINAYWYRRGIWNLRAPELEPLTNEQATEKVQKVLEREYATAQGFIRHLVETRPGFGSPNHLETNKLTNLAIAAECGMRVPDSHLIHTKAQLVKLLTQYGGQVLVKGMHQLAMYLTLNGQKLHHVSGIITDEMLDSVPETFPLSLAQEYIPKRQDIRIFYLDGRIWSAAIFSQNDAQTTIDFRNYNYDRPNRTVPFQLPAAQETMLHAFMKRVGMRSGSIDIVYARNKEFVFLEVNPVGQFGMISHPCNFHLERAVAHYLSA